MASLLQQRAAALRPAGWICGLQVLALLAAAVGAAAAVQFICAELVASGRFDPYTIRVLSDIGIWVILAVSLNIVNGLTGQFSIGHAGFFAVGGYTAAAITFYGSLLLWGSFAPREGALSSGTLLFGGAMLAGGGLAALAGYVVGLPSLRLRGDYLAIVTLGFGEIVRVLFELSNTQLYDATELREARWRDLMPPPLGGAQGFTNAPAYASLFWVYLLVALTLVFAARLKKSSTGRALLSIREDEIAAQAMGVNITQLKVRAFVFGAFFAGLAGALYAHQGTLMQPADAGFQRSFDVVIMVVLGGMGSISGAAAAAVLLSLTGEWLREPTHVWHLGIYAGLVCCALSAQRRWRYPLRVLAIVAVVELVRWFAGNPLAFTLGDVRVPLAELLYLVALLAVSVTDAGMRRVIPLLLGLTLAVELVRAGALAQSINLGAYRMIIYALILILMMIFRPSGLFGIHEITAYLPRWKRHGSAA